jgi:hypothetical protein
VAQQLDPASDVTTASWAIGGGSATHAAAQSDASDATYSTGNTEGAPLEMAVDPGFDCGDAALHRLFVRKHNRGVSVVSTWLDVSIVQGALVIATWRIDMFGLPGITDFTFDLTEAEASAITDYTDLRVREVDARTGATIIHEVYKSYILLDDPPAAIADFVADVTSGFAPLSVNFTNLSDTAGGDGLLSDWTYLWDFGAGEGTSTDVHPSHVYATPGTYTVSLTVTAPGGNDTETKIAYIEVLEVPPPEPEVLRGRFDRRVGALAPRSRARQAVWP